METKDVPDRIAEMFEGKTVFITGGTGFVGRPLIEKLLRSTNVKTLYLLIRPKKGKLPLERLKEIFNNVVRCRLNNYINSVQLITLVLINFFQLFKRLLEEKPNAMSKCSVIFGDVTEVDLGISSKQRETLKTEVDFIFHSAATTRFDDTLEYTVKMNTRGTKYMLDLAEQCHHLKVSYTFCCE